MGGVAGKGRNARCREFGLLTDPTDDTVGGMGSAERFACMIESVGGSLELACGFKGAGDAVAAFVFAGVFAAVLDGAVPGAELPDGLL